MLKIWGRDNSINVQKVMWCVGQLGLEHQRIDAGMQFGGNKEQWYLALNPNGLVPLIDDDGFTLWESNTIVRYLAAKHDSGGLYPDPVAARADCERWMDWERSTLTAPMTTVFWNLIRMPEAERDLQAVAKAAKAAEQCFAILDRHLAERQYVGGDHLTVGDIPVGAMTYRWYQLDIEHPPLEHLRDWYDRLCAIAAFNNHVMLPLT